MVLADLGRRINAAMTDITRSNVVDEKVVPYTKLEIIGKLTRLSGV
jgi:hypothetical protein